MGKTELALGTQDLIGWALGILELLILIQYWFILSSKQYPLLILLYNYSHQSKISSEDTPIKQTTLVKEIRTLVQK